MQLQFQLHIVEKTNDYDLLAAITINEHFGRCNKYNIIDAFNFIHEYGLMSYICRDEIYCIDCKYNTCIEIDEKTNWFHGVERETYKGGKPYRIEGKDNIKKEIYKNGPVVFSYTLYDDMAFYKKGLIAKASGNKIGTHEAVVYGWDSEGWLAQSTIGEYWGEAGNFRVSYDNDFGFGENVFAKSLYKEYSILLLILYITLIL